MLKDELLVALCIIYAYVGREGGRGEGRRGEGGRG